MYLGFMKMGLSLLLGFMLSLALVNLTGLGALTVIPITIYIYAFFHANNIGALDDQRFYALEDVYLLGFDRIGSADFQLEGRVRSIASIVFILIGISMLGDIGFGMMWNYVGDDNPLMKFIYYTVRDVVPRVLMAIAIIWFGIYLLRGKKVPRESVPRIGQKPQDDQYGQAGQIQVNVESGQDAQAEQNQTGTEGGENWQQN